MADTSITFEFQKLSDRATVGIDDVSFAIVDNGIQLDSNSGPVTLQSLSVSSKTIVLTAGTSPIADATIRVYIESSGDMPKFIGGPLSLPSGTTFTVSVDRGDSAQFTSDNNNWSITTSK